jgi:hypothetical protein
MDAILESYLHIRQSTLNILQEIVSERSGKMDFTPKLSLLPPQAFSDGAVLLNGQREEISLPERRNAHVTTCTMKSP